MHAKRMLRKAWSRMAYTLYSRNLSAAGALSKEGPATAQQASQAVAAGVDKIMFYGGAKAGNRTMLDAILPASEALRSALVSGER